jgi:hypothetical protein
VSAAVGVPVKVQAMPVVEAEDGTGLVMSVKLLPEICFRVSEVLQVVAENLQA